MEQINNPLLFFILIGNTIIFNCIYLSNAAGGGEKVLWCFVNTILNN